MKPKHGNKCQWGDFNQASAQMLAPHGRQKANLPSWKFCREVHDHSIPRDELAPSIGLALSAGGARALAHIGVIQVLEEVGIPIAAISGASMGAYVGSLWAAGLNGRELEKLALEIHDRNTLLALMDPMIPPTQGLIRGHKIRQHLEKSLHGLKIEDLSIPMMIVATDLDGLTSHTFKSGDIAEAVHASAAIPGVCAPVCVRGRRYIDGAAVNPLPVEVLIEETHVDFVIAVSVVPSFEDFITEREVSFCRDCHAEGESGLARWSQWIRRLNPLAEGNIINTYRRTIMASQMKLAEFESRKADILIRPRPAISTWHDFQNAPRYIKAGREAAQAWVPKMRDLLKVRTSMDHFSIQRGGELRSNHKKAHDAIHALPNP